MYEKNKPVNTQNHKYSKGRIIAIDLGSKYIGVAICDELQITSRPLPVIKRSSWKKLLNSISDLIETFDAKALVIGLPLNIDGSESFSSSAAKRIAKNFSLSLKIPVYLQDERLTTFEATERLKADDEMPINPKEVIDSKAAQIILEDFLSLDKGAKTNIEEQKD